MTNQTDVGAADLGREQQGAAYDTLLPTTQSVFETLKEASEETEVSDDTYLYRSDSGETSLHKSTWASIKGWLKSYFDAIYLGRSDKASDAERLDGLEPGSFLRSDVETYGLNRFRVTYPASGVLDTSGTKTPYSMVSADSFHTNGLGDGQMWIEGHAMDSNGTIYIGTGRAGGQSSSQVWVNNPCDGDGNTLYSTGNFTLDVDGSPHSVPRRDSSGDVHARLFRSDFQTNTNNVEALIGRISQTNNYLRPISVSSVANQIASNMVFTGTGSHASSLPIGHTVLVQGSVLKSNNSATAVYSHTLGGGYVDGGSTAGTRLAGSWRFRGFSGDGSFLAQRVS